MIDAKEFITTYCLRTGQSIYEDVEQDIGIPSESFQIDKNSSDLVISMDLEMA